MNFFAGDFHVVTEAGDVKSGETVRKYAPVIKTADGISEATENGLANLHGIAAGNSTDGGVKRCRGKTYARGAYAPQSFSACAGCKCCFQ